MDRSPNADIPQSGPACTRQTRQFGNALRRALELDFTVLGHNFRVTSRDDREAFAASELAKLFLAKEDAKLLVHAGHAHVLKYQTEYCERWLASRLWNKSDSEPHF